MFVPVGAVLGDDVGTGVEGWIDGDDDAGAVVGDKVGRTGDAEGLAVDADGMPDGV
jgi:hypothetical protein